MARDKSAAKSASTYRSEYGFLFLLFGVALVVRLVYLWQAAQTPLFYAPGVDESWHHLWANELLDRGWAYPHVYFRAPLYPYFLAFLYAVSDRSILFARVVQVVISAGSVIMFYLLARRLLQRNLARLAAGVLCVYGTLIWYEQALLIPVLIVFLDLLLLYLLLRYKQSPGVRILIVSGLVAGLSLVARPNIAVFLLAAGVWILWRKRKKRGWKPAIGHAALFLGTAALPLLPVTAHNYNVTGDFIPIASQGGINFYLGNNPVADGLTMQLPEVRLDEMIPWDEFVPTTDSIARVLAGRQLSPGEVSGFWGRRMLAYAFSDPLDFLGGLLRKTYFFFAGVENSDNFDLYFYRGLVPLHAALLWRYGLHFPFGLISPLAILGLVWLWPKHRDLDLLYLFFLTYAPTVIGVLVTARHRLPVIPILVLFAIWGGLGLYRRVRDGTMPRRVLWGSLAALLFILLNTELFGIGFENRRQSFVNLALAHQKLGQTEKMTAALDSALAIDSNSVVALNNRATAYLNQGDLYMAGRLLSRAALLQPQATEIRLNQAVVMERQGRLHEAAALYHRVQRDNPSLPEPFFNLGRMAATLQVYDTALAYYDSALARDPMFVEAINNKGSVHLALGDRAQALLHFTEAYNLRPGYATAAINLIRHWAEGDVTDSARAVLARAGSPWRHSADWYYFSAQTFLAAGDTTSAQRDAAAAVRVDPRHAAALNLARRLGVR